MARQRGFTLIELMISVTIGLVILAALVGVLAANSGQSQSNEKTSELNTNGRFALNSLKQELRQAGLLGYTFAEPNTPAALGLPTNPTANTCFGAGSSYDAFVSNMHQGVWGTNNSNPFAANCIAGTQYAAGNDVLLVRRVAGIPAAALTSTGVYFESSFAQGQIFKGLTAPSFGTVTPLANFQVQQYVYYVSPFTTSATESPVVPSLHRVSLNISGAMVDELVVSGIEHMQVRYGRLLTDGTTRYLDASNIPGSLVDTPTTNASYGWDQVNAVQVWLLARNAVAETGYSNTETYVMGDTTVTKADSFRRELFTTVVKLRNCKQIPC
jgi:type IV pilus assembly protein PilW